MTVHKRNDNEGRLTCAVARTVSPSVSMFYCLLAAIVLGTLAGCGSRGPETSVGSPPATKPVREPLPIVPEQSEPEQSDTGIPVGAESIDKAATNDAAVPVEAVLDATPKEPADKLSDQTEQGIETNLPSESSKTPEEGEPSRYEFRGDHDPNGIGKFYMGREIAHVMGFAAAPWLERPEREREEATSKLITALSLEPGMVVADIGAGSGVLTLPIRGKVGRKGKVFAVDVQQEMLDRLAGKLRLRKIENVVLVLGTEKDPRLEPECLDLALMVDVYHEFAFPYEMLLEISKAMKPGGRVVFVEFRMEDPQVPIKLVHKMTEAQVKKEASLPEFRLKWKETIGTLPWQHVIVFEKLANPTGEAK
jgi:precorrin-6B methylase 2/predicted small lipoprotein YifL